jgi:ATP-dependent Lon protease
VQAAMTWVRSCATKYGIDPDLFKTSDIHIHMPAGAIPKDGPSAGTAMYTALVSLLTGKTVGSDLAMTGEISLRGLVLPIGGVKEKTVAAHRAGIRRVLLPARNRKDLEDVPQSVRDEMKFVFCERVEDVIAEALGITSVTSITAAA